MTTSTVQQVKQSRERVPISAQRDKFKFRNLRPDKFYYRLIDITKPDRVAKFMDAGYAWVREDGQTKAIDGVNVSKEEAGSIITVRGGLGVTLGLVCLPRSIHEQDQKIKMDDILETERAMKDHLNSLANPRMGGYGSASISDK